MQPVLGLVTAHSSQMGRNYKREWREYLFELQRGLCHYCGVEMSLTARTKNGFPARNFATFEHLQRLVDGGKTNSHNVVLAHRKCNHRANIQTQAQSARKSHKVRRYKLVRAAPGQSNQN